MCLSGLWWGLRDESGGQKGETKPAQIHRATPRTRAQSLCGSGVWETAREQLPDFIRLVVERALAAAIADRPVGLDDVEALRPRRGDAIGGVAHGVHEYGDGVMETAGEVIGNADTVLERLRLPIAY